MDLTQTINDCFMFLDFYHGKLPGHKAKVLEHQHLFKTVEAYTSGGHICHLFMQLLDDRIISLHLDGDTAEISNTKWGTIDDYIYAGYEQDNVVGGFGWENQAPLYEERSTSLDTWETLLNK